MGQRRPIFTAAKPPSEAEFVGTHGTSNKAADDIVAKGGPDLEKAGTHGEHALGQKIFSTTMLPEVADDNAAKAARKDGSGPALVDVHRVGDAKAITTRSRPPVPEIAQAALDAQPGTHEFRTSLQADGKVGETGLTENARDDQNVTYHFTKRDE